MKKIFEHTNTLMDQYLIKLEKSRGIVECNMKSIHTLIVQNIISYNERIIIESNLNLNTISMIDDFNDITSFEAFINHIHASDFINGPKKSIIYLITGINIAYLIKIKLKTLFPYDKFKIITSYDVKLKNDCVIRFHKVNKNEENWLSDNLEEYKHEAIGVIEV